MASRGTTFAKQERDRAKKAKAAAKREKRAEERTDEPDEAAEPVDVGEGAIPAEELLALVARLHEDFEAKRIDFEEFEERKAELMARIDVT
jgi:ubiquitin